MRNTGHKEGIKQDKMHCSYFGTCTDNMDFSHQLLISQAMPRPHTCRYLRVSQSAGFSLEELS